MGDGEFFTQKGVHLKPGISGEETLDRRQRAGTGGGETRERRRRAAGRPAGAGRAGAGGRLCIF